MFELQITPACIRKRLSNTILKIQNFYLRSSNLVYSLMVP